MLTFLDLVNDLITELGINGGQLLSSTGGGYIGGGGTTPGTPNSTLSPEVAKVVKAIADADYEIQSLHQDWDFLWRQYRGTFQVGQDWLATAQRANGSPLGYTGTPYTMRRIDRNSLTINYTSQTASFRPKFMPWREFEMLWQSRGNKQSSDYPTNWTITPAGNPLVSATSATGLTYQYEGWCRPRRLSDDGDLSELVLAVQNSESGSGAYATASLFSGPPYALQTPSTSASLMTRSAINAFSGPSSSIRHESCRIILARAAVILAGPEGATELTQAYLAEYQDLLEALRSDQLPGMRADRMSQSDEPMQIWTP